MNSLSVQQTYSHQYPAGMANVQEVDFSGVSVSEFTDNTKGIQIRGVNYLFSGDARIDNESKAVKYIADLINASPDSYGVWHSNKTPDPTVYARAEGSALVLFGRVANDGYVVSLQGSFSATVTSLHAGSVTGESPYRENNVCTVDTSGAYSSGDKWIDEDVGVSGVYAPVSGIRCLVTDLIFVDVDGNSPALDLFFSTGEFSNSDALNSAFTLSDADLKKVDYFHQVVTGDWVSPQGSSGTILKVPIDPALPMNLSTTMGLMGVVTGSVPTYTGATSLNLRVGYRTFGSATQNG